MAAPLVKRRLRFFERGGIPLVMNDDRAASRKAFKAAEKLSREDRLAANLRENLRRRKAQSRSAAAELHPDDDSESVRLPKASPES
ncbi:hypothetical protein [Novosphingobium sp. AP12]|uniref:hypothetical protein n=1 Tax=Novosphingobium sp. AP12 TaxID=1144305 RepID=UPI0002EC0FFB|nr:hypothetical protein [Novosphingobium sp. AP12]